MSNVSFVEVVDAGPGWTKVKASNGEVYTLKGDRNWRNNNPGNLEYGNFARSKGAIGSDGRFAVFPTYDAGFKAQSDLQFESSRYKDLTISEAISRYAPEFENNTAAYAASVAAAAGVSLDTKMSELTPSQRAAFLQEQQRVEGFKVGRIIGEDGKPVPASVARQFSAVPLPPADIPLPSNADDIGEGATAGMLSRFGQGASPVAMSREAALRFGRESPSPATPSLAVQLATGRTAPMPRPRPEPSYGTPITEAAGITPMTFPSEERSPLTQLLSRGIVDSVRSPTLFSEGVGIPNEQIPGSDATYSGANRMSVGGLGALLDPRSFSPSTPNPTPLPQPSGPSNRGRPVVSAPPPLPQPSGPTGRGRPTSASRSTSTPTPTYSGTTKTTGGIAGTVQLPRDVRPNVPQIAPPSPPSTMSSMGFSQGTVPQYITKTIQVANPDYKQVNPGNPTLAAMGFSPGTMPTVPKTISKTISVPNPAYSPMPATQSQSLALQRAAAAPTNYITAGQYTYTKGPNGYQRVTAPTPATQSAALAAQRSGTSTKAKTSSASTSLPSATFSGTSKGTDGKTRSFDTSTNRWVVVG